MAAHPLVDQLRFTRSEWLRGLEGITEEEANQHLGTMNCISWIVGHMAWHEQRYWLVRAQNRILIPVVNEICAYGGPMTTPSLAEMKEAWHTVTQAVDPYLDTLTTETLQNPLLYDGQPAGQSIGSAMRRMTYHYWFHTGEILAIRQVLGHTGLPEYVGDIEGEAPYRPE
jgi:uncharacterized damage-inducible protein DinB